MQVLRCTTLIPDTFPQSNFRFLYSSHSGVTCHKSTPCVSMALIAVMISMEILIRSRRPIETDIDNMHPIWFFAFFVNEDAIEDSENIVK